MSNRVIADAIAKRIMANSKKRFGSLYADALEEIMSTPTTSTSINTTATHEATLDRSKIGSPADGRKLNATGSTGVTINSGLNVGQNSEVTPINVKLVDGKEMGASYRDRNVTKSGDFAKASVDRIANADGPRSAVEQFPLSSKTPAASAPESFLGAEGSDQN